MNKSQLKQLIREEVRSILGNKINEGFEEKKIVIKKSELGKPDSVRDLYTRAWREFVIRYTKQNNIKYKNQAEAEYIVKNALKIPYPDYKYYEDSARYLVNKGILVIKESINEDQFRRAYDEIENDEIKTRLKSQFVNEDEEFTDNLNIGDKVRIDKQEFEKRYPMYKLYADKGEIWDMEKTDYFSDEIIISVTIKHKDPIGNHDILSIEPQDYDLIEII